MDGVLYRVLPSGTYCRVHYAGDLGITTATIASWLREPAYSWLISFILNRAERVKLECEATVSGRCVVDLGPDVSRKELAYWKGIMQFQPKPVEALAPGAGDTSNLIDFQTARQNRAISVERA